MAPGPLRMTAGRERGKTVYNDTRWVFKDASTTRERS